MRESDRGERRVDDAGDRPARWQPKVGEAKKEREMWGMRPPGRRCDAMRGELLTGDRQLLEDLWHRGWGNFREMHLNHRFRYGGADQVTMPSLPISLSVLDALVIQLGEAIYCCPFGEMALEINDGGDPDD